MIRELAGFPADTLAVEIRGRITKQDYKDVLIPAAEEKMAGRKEVKILCVIGLLDAFEFGAIWEDAAFGLRHWREFSRIAIVTDYDWIKSIISLMKPFMPAEMRLYKGNQLEAAREWLKAPAASKGQKVA